MPEVAVSIPHSLRVVEAKSRIADRILHFQDPGGAVRLRDELWNGDQLDFRVFVRGVAVAGQLSVHSDRVCIVVKLAWLLVPFSAAITSAITRHVRTCLPMTEDSWDRSRLVRRQAMKGASFDHHFTLTGPAIARGVSPHGEAVPRVRADRLVRGRHRGIARPASSSRHSPGLPPTRTVPCGILCAVAGCTGRLGRPGGIAGAFGRHSPGHDPGAVARWQGAARRGVCLRALHRCNPVPSFARTLHVGRKGSDPCSCGCRPLRQRERGPLCLGSCPASWQVGRDRGHQRTRAAVSAWLHVWLVRRRAGSGQSGVRLPGTRRRHGRPDRQDQRTGGDTVWTVVRLPAGPSGRTVSQGR
ncbi:MAG: polyhydroxyalkanoic acid system family protein [Gemmataceae bacterium]|nr:polyhydroxyalkanoic acid system family protein [Gemmataceae bacterium]